MSLRLVQLLGTDGERIVAAATTSTTAGRIRGATSVYSLAIAAVAANTTLSKMLDTHGYGDEIDLAEALRCKRILSPVDHPDSARVFLTGTGLTHLGSADARDRMHAKA